MSGLTVLGGTSAGSSVSVNGSPVTSAAFTDATGSDLAALGALLKTLVDAKGDLLVGSADDTVIRKAIGSDGQVLTADAASAGGVKWAAASGSAGGAERFVAGRYYDKGGALGTLALSLNRQYFQRFHTTKGFTLDRLAIETTTSTATAVLRLGVYVETTGLPGALFAAESGALDASGTGAVIWTPGSPIVIPADTEVFFSCINQTAAATVRTTTTSDANLPIYAAGTPTAAASGNAGLFDTTSRSGAMPDPAGTTFGASSGIPQFRFRVA